MIYRLSIFGKGHISCNVVKDKNSHRRWYKWNSSFWLYIQNPLMWKNMWKRTETCLIQKLIFSHKCDLFFVNHTCGNRWLTSQPVWMSWDIGQPNWHAQSPIWYIHSTMAPLFPTTILAHPSNPHLGHLDWHCCQPMSLAQWWRANVQSGSPCHTETYVWLKGVHQLPILLLFMGPSPNHIPSNPTLNPAFTLLLALWLTSAHLSKLVLAVQLAPQMSGISFKVSTAKWSQFSPQQQGFQKVAKS